MHKRLRKAEYDNIVHNSSTSNIINITRKVLIYKWDKTMRKITVKGESHDKNGQYYIERMV